MGIIPWDKVEVGKEYLYEENYFFQGRIRILEKSFGENVDYISYKIKIIQGNPKKFIGEEWSVGKNINEEFNTYTNDMNFISLDGFFTYSGVMDGD